MHGFPMRLYAALVLVLALSWCNQSFAKNRRRAMEEEGPYAATPGEILLLPGRKFPIDWRNGDFKIQDAPIFVFEEENTGLGTGLTVWDGAPVLAGYLESNFAEKLTGASVVEVGSGTGLVGVAAAVLGARVYLTDLSYCLHNLQRVIDANRGSISAPGHAEAVALDWTAPHTSALPRDALPPQYVLGADVVWVPELIQPLVDTLSYLAGPSPSPTTILLSHQTRSRASDALLLNALEGAGFTVNTVPRREHHDKWNDQAIEIFEITRR